MVELNSKYDSMDNWDDIIDEVEQIYWTADKSSAGSAIDMLIDTYLEYEERDPFTDSIVDDKDAVDFLKNYWAYVKWNEHGNEASLYEVGGIKGLCGIITEDYTGEYLIPDGMDNANEEQIDLYNRWRSLNRRYSGIGKSRIRKSDIVIDEDDSVLDFLSGLYDTDSRMEQYVIDEVDEMYGDITVGEWYFTASEVIRDLTDDWEEVKTDVLQGLADEIERMLSVGGEYTLPNGQTISY